MTTTTIELPTSVEITSRGRTVLIAPESFPAAVLTQALEHGLRQKIADAAASALSDAFAAAHSPEETTAATPDARKAWGNDNPAAVADAAQSAMETAINNLREHGWTVRTPGVGTLTDAQKIAVGLVRDALKRAGGASWKEYAALEKASEKTAHLLALAEKPANAKKLAPIVARIMAESGPDLDL